MTSDRFFNQKVVFLPLECAEWFEENKDVEENYTDVQQRLETLPFLRIKHIFCFNGFSIDLKKKSAFGYLFNIFLSQVYEENFIAEDVDTLFILVGFVMLDPLFGNRQRLLQPLFGVFDGGGLFGRHKCRKQLQNCPFPDQFDHVGKEGGPEFESGRLLPGE